ncbi:hypothetical protein L593_06220 [Salinarchaeum sp. Harcht-Bsk1]|uniref:DUF5305 domain-containing protein n=1 Tax=Salinarchaeum sp. Harcht-Bsk1 TaxID=1333523 RepID=UPI00034233BF|nr:DUF5305 domain-containing protein [Salinarchaeum sp. Harcht-Bsk1]AGN01193.1 hypothetical protein L593_06220 [Salinarchaeum sp. Harcht-Bsk1]
MIENPRVRLALAEHGRRIALALAILGAVLLVLAIWTVVTPASETVRQPADSQTIETEVSHSAVVQSADSPWEQGTTLQDHPAYLLNASPTLDVAVRTDAPPGSTVVHDARLQLRVVRNGDVVWEETRALAAEEQTATNGTAISTAAIDVERLQAQRRDLQEQFAGVGTVQTRIVADARYETDTYEGTLSATGPLTVTNRAYWIDGDPSDSAARSRTVTVERTAPVDWGTVALFVVLGLLAVGGAAAAATYRVEADIDWLQQEVHRQRYDDWISDGNLPMGVGSEYVALDSLKDVVDVAIDTNQRVVYDDRRNVFAVISGEVVYYYSKDGDWNRVAWPQTQSDDSGPSFLEAFGMGDEDVPGAEATPPGDGGFGGGPDAGDGPGFASGGADAVPADAASDSSADESDDADATDADDAPEAVFGTDEDAADPPDDAGGDGSVGPAERPPEDRPFGGDDEE